MEKTMVETRLIPLTAQSTTPSNTRSTSSTDIDATTVQAGEEDTAPTYDGETDRWYPGYYLRKMVSGRDALPTSSSSSFGENRGGR